MYTIINSEPGLYTVGFYSPDNVWHPYEDFTDKETAGEKCNFLNGGKIPKPVLILRIPTEVTLDSVRDFINSNGVLSLRNDYWVLVINGLRNDYEVEIVSVKGIDQNKFQEIEAAVFNFLNKI